MDVNRRHLMGASAAGLAGALAMSPEPLRAAPLTSALGRDATQFGVRPGSPDDQTRALQRAIDAEPDIIQVEGSGTTAMPYVPFGSVTSEAFTVAPEVVYSPILLSP